jgi:hypothetical protein
MPTRSSTSPRSRRTKAERERADILAGFLTPISKACLTEWSIENTYNAVQCFGGHGYIAEHGIEQLARDARITTLYEGTTGIQSLDLIGRKTAATQGAGLKLFLAEVEAFAKQHEGDEALAEFIAPLRAKAAEWGKLTMDVLQRAASNPEELGAASTDYLFYSGYVVLAYWWARSVAAANAPAARRRSRMPSATPPASTSRACCRARWPTRRRSKAARHR